jgi:hypothetical protein
MAVVTMYPVGGFLAPIGLSLLLNKPDYFAYALIVSTEYIEV